MKIKILAIVTAILTLAFAMVNTVITEKKIADIGDALERIDYKNERAAESAKAVYDGYRSVEGYIALSIDRGILREIDETFCEMIEYFELGMAEEGEIAKSRLSASFLHLRRLSKIIYI